MSLRDIILDSISEDAIRNLISNGIPESLTIEYKRDSYGGSDEAKREFLSDVSSFANTIGGDIVIGLDETNGFPTAIVPLSVDVDAETRRLESIAITGLEPRITNLRIRPVPVSGGHAIVIRVPRSFIPPHRVIASGSNRFFARAGARKYEPSVEQLRHLFSDIPGMLDHVRAFHVDRLIKVNAAETPIALGQRGKVIVHAIPLPSFADGRMADIFSELRKGTHVPTPLSGFNISPRYTMNLDGYLSYTDSSPDTPQAYAQFFRNGAIEGVGELPSDDNMMSRFITRDFTNLIVSRSRQYLDVLKAYDLGLPVYIFLGLCNADRIVYRYPEQWDSGWHERGPIGRNIVSLPEIYVDDYNVDIIDALKPAFNTLWNGFGFNSCERYEDLTRWKASDPYRLWWH